MDGIHDLGGMDGFGPIEIEEDEPVFHHPWEGWTYTLFVAGLGSGAFNIDEFRHAIERMAPDDYLAAGYYERWLAGIERLLVEKGTVSPEEIDEREAAVAAGEEPPEPEEPGSGVFSDLIAGVERTFDVERDPEEPAFGPGDRVRVRNMHPEGHTRCPRYVRRAEGTVEAVRGTYVLPDASAHGREAAEPMYNVRFEAAELWGDDAEGSAVRIELWESYLKEPNEGS